MGRYKKSHAAASAKALPPAERYRCAIEFDGVQCLEAGTLTDAIIGPGKSEADHRRWLCRWHYPLQHDPVACRLVLDDLLAHRQPTPDNWREKLVRTTIEENRDDPLMARALLIAEGKGDDEDKRDLLRDLQRKLGRFVDRSSIGG